MAERARSVREVECTKGAHAFPLQPKAMRRRPFCPSFSRARNPPIDFPLSARSFYYTSSCD